MTQSSPERFAREVVLGDLYADELRSDLERRLTAVEEVLARPWPFRLLAAGRFGRQLRRQVAPYAWAGPGFYQRRLEQTTSDWLLRERSGLAAEIVEACLRGER
jgi:hypothetical protein